jgi:hypothetical protein
LVIKDTDLAGETETMSSMKRAYEFINAMLRADSIEEYIVTQSDLNEMDSMCGTNYIIYKSVSSMPEGVVEEVLNFKRFKLYQEFMEKGDENSYYQDIYDTYYASETTIYDDIKDFNRATSLPILASMRLASDFSLLWYPSDILSAVEVSKFKTAYSRALTYFMKVCYNEAYQVTNVDYKKLCRMFIVFLAMKQYLNMRLENVDDIDFFDEYSIRNLFLSYGLDYFFDMPLKYQRRILKNINQLIKNKGTDKGLVSVLSVFGFDNIKIMRYILAKEYEKDPETGKILIDNPQLRFYELSNSDTRIEDAIANANEYDYDSFVAEDKYWQLTDEQTALLYKEDFNYIYSKYISVASYLDMMEYSFQFSYFVNFIYRIEDMFHVQEDKSDLDKLFFYDTLIGSGKIGLFDSILALFSLVMKKYNFKDVILTNPNSIARVYDFNLDEFTREVKFYKDKKLLPSTIEAYKKEHLYYPDPDDSFTQSDLIELFTHNYEFRKELETIILEENDRRKYQMYQSLYKCCFLGKYRSEVFGDFETFKDYLEVNSPELYNYIDQCEEKAATVGNDWDEVFNQYILEICNDIDVYLDDEALNFVIQGNSILTDYVREFIYQLINFIKSYTVSIKDLTTIYVFGDKFSNTIKYFDEIDFDDKQAIAELYNTNDLITWGKSELTIDVEEYLQYIEAYLKFCNIFNQKDYLDMYNKDTIKTLTNIDFADLFRMFTCEDFKNFVKEVEEFVIVEGEIDFNYKQSYQEKLIENMEYITNKYYKVRSELLSVCDIVDNNSKIACIDLEELKLSDNTEVPKYLYRMILTEHICLSIQDKVYVDTTYWSTNDKLHLNEVVSPKHTKVLGIEQFHMKDKIKIQSTAYDNIFSFIDLLEKCVTYQDINIIECDLNRLIGMEGYFQNSTDYKLSISQFGNVQYYVCSDNKKHYDFVYQDGKLILSKHHGNIQYVYLANAKIQYLEKRNSESN